MRVVNNHHPLALPEILYISVQYDYDQAHINKFLDFLSNIKKDFPRIIKANGVILVSAICNQMISLQ